MLEPLFHPPNPYADPEEKRRALIFGMWLFLGTEVMLFGGLFLALSAYRVLYPAAFDAGSHHMNLLLGSLNTFVLLTSSLTMAIAVRAAQLDEPKSTSRWLLATAGLGLLFLGVKVLEYTEHITHGQLPGPGFEGPERLQLFFVLYFVMTGLHALHLTIGTGLLYGLSLLTRQRDVTVPVEMVGLYWHFVDVVWIFLFPMLYLIGHH